MNTYFLSRKKHVIVLLAIQCNLLLFSKLIAQNGWQDGQYNGLFPVNALTATCDFKYVFASGSSGETNKMGLYRADPDIQEWSQIYSNSVVRKISISPDQTLFMGTAGFQILKSTNTGLTWGLSFNNVLASSFVFNSQGIVFMGAGFGIRQSGVFRSEDNGASWQKTNNGLADTSVFTMAVGRDTKEFIFAGTASGIYRSSDNADSWEPIFESNSVVAFAIDSDNHIFAAIEGGGVFLSTQNGDRGTWSSLNTNLSNSNMTSLVVNGDDHIFAGTNGGGVFQLRDGENSWSEFNVEITDKKIFSLAVNCAGILFLGSQGAVERTVTSTLTPPKIGTPLFSSTLKEHKQAQVEVNIQDKNGVGNATLFYRKGGDAEFTQVPLSGTDNLFEAIVPESAVTSQGLEYYVEAWDAINDYDLWTRFPEVGHLSTSVEIQSESNSAPQPSAKELKENAYRLISVPFQSNNASVSSVFGNNIGEYDDRQWRLFGFTASGEPVEHPQAGDFAPGKSLFLIVRKPDVVIDAGPGQSVRTDEEFAIALQPGYNFIATPFNFTIPKSNLRLASGAAIEGLKTFNGDWVDANALQTWEGYLLSNNDPSNVDTLYINPDLSAAQNTNAAKIPLQDWNVQIKAAVGEMRDENNFAGVSPVSQDGWDDYDVPEPPVVSNDFVSLSFVQDEWERFFKRYATDSRSAETANHVFDFEVESNLIGEIVTLEFEHIQAVPKHLEIFLVDLKFGHRQNLRELSNYRFEVENEPRKMKLLIGDAEFIAEETASSSILPQDFALHQNFPNPFNPETAIRFDLPEESRVSLKVFDITGREVATLLANEVLAAGRHQQIWLGRDDSGRALASGVYFYRLETTKFRQTLKMTMLR